MLEVLDFQLDRLDCAKHKNSDGLSWCSNCSQCIRVKKDDRH